MTHDRINLYDLSHKDLEEQLRAWGFPRFRADQLWNWLYNHKAQTFQDMHNLPDNLITHLNIHAQLGTLTVIADLKSSDGETRKFALQLPDGQIIETVLMEYDGTRRTACLSSQAGCAMGCVFCATGQMGFARNLTTGEIVEQAIMVARILDAEGERLSNIVMMGMGEPFHNYDATLDAVRRFMDPDGLGIGQRHITVSTVGLVPAIRRFTGEDMQVRLAISLHAATDEERSALLPVNRRYPISDLIEAVREYTTTSGRRVTFEWAAIAGENDTPEQAHALGSLLQGLLCHVNIIPLNPTAGYTGKKASADRITEFVNVLERYGLTSTVRVRRGIDINAGCGQLKASLLEDT